MAWPEDSVATARTVQRRVAHLVVGPTTTSGDFPYGGTYVGRVQRGLEMPLRPRVTPLVCYRERGAEPYDYAYAGWRETIIEIELGEWNADAVAVAFPGALTTVVSTVPTINLPGTLPHGPLEEDEGLKIAGISRDPAYPSVLLRRCVPFVTEDRPVYWRVTQVGSFLVRLRALRATGAPSGQEIGAIGLWSGMTL